jgi:hypothetical protein
VGLDQSERSPRRTIARRGHVLGRSHEGRSHEGRSHEGRSHDAIDACRNPGEAWATLSGSAFGDRIARVTKVTEREMVAMARMHASWAHTRIGGWIVVALFCGLLATGCSFAYSRIPSAPVVNTPRAAAKCGNGLYPLLDFASTIAGVTWVLAANNKEEESRSNPHSVDSGGERYDLMRYIGYGAIAVFGASTLWGTTVEIECASMRSDMVARETLRSEQAVHERAVPPTIILGFSFNMSVEQAAQVCAGKQSDWEVKGPLARCTPRMPSSQDNHPVVLQFESGGLQVVSVLHPSTDETFGKRYDDLNVALRKLYGPPQIAAPPLVGACQESLVECLKEGEKPKGSTWHWPTESIELWPTWEDGRAIVEERYRREAE